MALNSRGQFPKAGNLTALPADSIAFNGVTATVTAHAAAGRLVPLTVTGVTDPVLITKEKEISTSNR